MSIAGPSGKSHVLQQAQPPDDARDVSTLERIDYSDAFVLTSRSAPERTAEQWARAMLEGARLPRRLQLVIGWTALGLRLHAPWSRTNVLGWEIVKCTPDLVLLGTGSRFGIAGQLLFERRQDGLLFCTFVQLDNPPARAVWSRAIRTHQRVVAHLLAAAGRAQRASGL